MITQEGLLNTESSLIVLNVVDLYVKAFEKVFDTKRTSQLLRIYHLKFLLFLTRFSNCTRHYSTQSNPSNFCTVCSHLYGTNWFSSNCGGGCWKSSDESYSTAAILTVEIFALRFSDIVITRIRSSEQRQRPSFI